MFLKRSDSHGLWWEINYAAQFFHNATEAEESCQKLKSQSVKAVTALL